MKLQTKALAIITCVIIATLFSYNTYQTTNAQPASTTTAVVLNSFVNLPNGSLMQIQLFVAYANPSLDFTSNNIIYQTILINIVLPTSSTAVRAAETTAIQNQVAIINTLFVINIPAPLAPNIIFKGDY
jgi:hypothetical protein